MPPKVEKIILNLLFLQRLPIEDVARSIRRERREAIISGALGLLRVLPALRSETSAAA